jgi:kynurenine formamidase
MTKIIDLSKPIKYYKNDPFYMKVRIKHKPHEKSKGLIRFFLGIPLRLFPEKFKGWADDTIKNMGVHSTTHIDAPWHYSPTTGGEPSKTIDQMPLEWGYGDGLVLDLSYKNDFEIITVEDIEEAVKKIGVEIKSGNIVLIRTDRDKYIGTKKYPEIGTGMSREATEWLIDKGVKVMGIDQWGWDMPLKYSAKKARDTNDREFFWQGHLVGADKEYFHMEQLVNLKKLPSFGFKVAVFPLNIIGASAAPARVVAILNE